MPVEISVTKLLSAVAGLGGLVVTALGWHERRFRHLDRKIEDRSMTETQQQRIEELEAAQQTTAERVERLQQSAVSRDELDRHVASLQSSIEGLGRQIDRLSERLDRQADAGRRGS